MSQNKGISWLKKYKKRFIIFLLGFSIILYLTSFYDYNVPNNFPLFQSWNNNIFQSSVETEMTISLSDDEIDPEFLVYTKGCKIMYMDPFDKTVANFWKTGNVTSCPKKFSIVENMKIRIDLEQLKVWNMTNPKCCFKEIHRVQQNPKKYNTNADNVISYSSKCHPIPLDDQGANLTVPFVKVVCYGASYLKKTEFQGIVMPPRMNSNDTRKKVEFWDQRTSQGLEKNVPSILVIGLDSVSRLQMMRSLPKTREFLLENDFIEMKGYTKVGENTFPNIMAGFGGLEEHQFKQCWANKAQKLDDCPLIWKNFSALNYITSLVEDSPGIAIFNFEKTGFVLPPADYYLRPLFLGINLFIHSYHGWQSRYTGCIEGLSPTDFLATFVKNFVQTMGKSYPYFLFSWFTGIGHGHFNSLKTADDTFHKLFKLALSNKTADPENTIIIFMSDHGCRYGGFRETFMGFYEDNLPFLLLRLPKSLKRWHPTWHANLKRNSRRLTSPFDLYSTLTQVLKDVQETLSHTKDKTSRKNSIRSNEPFRMLPFQEHYSLFDIMPNNRTCESSKIPQRYCMCGVTPTLSSNSSLTKHFGDIVISHVNFFVQTQIRSGTCLSLNVSKFLYGRQLGKGEVWNDFGKLVEYKDYLVALEATPGKAHFEAKIRSFQNSTSKVLGDISRINSYEGQSDCISDFKFKSYCMCKSAINYYIDDEVSVTNDGNGNDLTKGYISQIFHFLKSEITSKLINHL